MFSILLNCNIFLSIGFIQFPFINNTRALRYFRELKLGCSFCLLYKLLLHVIKFLLMTYQNILVLIKS